MPRNFLFCACWLLLLVQLPMVGLAADKIPPAQVEFFEKKIRPVLVKHCYQCHSADSKQLKGGLRLDTREHTRMGGDSGQVIVPGQPDDSLLMEALHYNGLEMPPSSKLSDDVIADFEAWIAGGAADPRESSEKLAIANKEIDWEVAREFWAYQPIVRSELPQVKQRSWPAHPIDHFVLARLEAKQLTPVADADRRTLARRLYFDLIGLPPSPEQLEAFLSDKSPQALEKLVDELLASERFGERWGRHWLDVARFGESSGRERNHTFPHAWRYRDYVIDAVNTDLPYDRFITEQIAGDLLDYQDENQRQRQIIATGFLAIGPKTLNERDRKQFEMNTIDDQIDTIGRSILGMTIGCARCHDHKFDPIPAADYYALAGIFTSTETLFGVTSINNVRQTSGLMPLDDTTTTAGNTNQPREAIRKQNRQQALERELAAARKAKDREQINILQRQLRQLERRQSVAVPTDGSFAMAVREGKLIGDSPIYIRGEIDNVGERVPRGYLTIINGPSAPEIPQDQSGRLQLAQWLTSPENPLTARVFVNHVWQHLFGVGLVASSGNFGVSGDQPSHPELLDWLVADCIENGWSRKQLIRTIVLSRTYRLSAEYAPRSYALDPENRLIWRHSAQQLDVEALRDAMLTASGQINLDRPIGSPVSELGDRLIDNARDFANLQVDATRRSVYMPILRNIVPEMFHLFDFAEPGMVVTRRSETTAPPQALYMMNSGFVRKQAEHLAARVSDVPTPADRVRQIYLHAVSRAPEPDEVEQALQFIVEATSEWKEAGVQPESAEHRAWSMVAQALFASAEFRYLQ